MAAESSKEDILATVKKVSELVRGDKITALFKDVQNLKQTLAKFSTRLKESVNVKEKTEDVEKSAEVKAAAVAAKQRDKTIFMEAMKEQPQKAAETGAAPVKPQEETVKKSQVYHNTETAHKQYNNYQNNNQKSGNYQVNRTCYQNNNYQQRTYNNQNNQSNQNNQNTTRNPNFKPFNANAPRPAGTFNSNRPAGAFNGNRFAGAPNGSRPQGQGTRPFGQGTNTRFNGPRPAGVTGEKKFFAKTATADLLNVASAFVNKERDFTAKKKTVYNNSSPNERMSKRTLLRRGLIEEHSIEERMVSRKLKIKKDRSAEQVVIAAPVTHAVITTQNLTVKMLSEKIGKSATDIIKQFMMLGIPTTINSTIDFAAAELVSGEFGISLELKLDKTAEEKLIETRKVTDENDKERRAPIVTVMGHVDHGKTSLLDYIRKTSVTKAEAGGITQHIGAYTITHNKASITFIDTPGHAAFENMRKRGAQVTDIAILVIAADDGIKQQTVEAIKHIKQAKVPMIVAINKIDKTDANTERIKQQLAEHDVLPEEWGGDAILIPISAKLGTGIDKLLETIILVADMQELKANSKREAVGTVIEARLDKGLGPVANIIVQNGTLKVGDNIVSGFAYGKVRALIDDKGKRIQKAGPSTPVSILGMSAVPNAGDFVQVVDEKLIKNVISERRTKLANEKAENASGMSLDEFLKTTPDSKKSLKLIIKGDVQGSVEALKQSLDIIENDEVKVDVIKAEVGNINERDVSLAEVSGAEIICFNVKADSKTQNIAEKAKVSIKNYSIIYKVIEDINTQIDSMLAPKFAERVTGHAEIRVLFKISKMGTIAGCMAIDGKIVRGGKIRVQRSGNTIFTGDLESLKIVKDEVKEVNSGFECGIKIKDYNDILEGDILECFVNEQIK